MIYLKKRALLLFKKLKSQVMKKIFFSARVPLFAVIGMLVAGGLFTACKKSNDIPNTPVAGLMAFNLAPDKPAVRIKLSGSDLLQSPLTYTGFTGGYSSIYTGARNIETFGDSSVPFASASYSFEPNKYYSLFVTGNNGTYNNLVVLDNFDSLSANSGQAYIRYINAIPDSSKPLVHITAGSSTIFNTNAGFSSVSEFAAVPPGELNIGLTNEGTINTSRIITVEQKKVYTILLLGNPAATDTTTKVQIRFVENGSL